MVGTIIIIGMMIKTDKVSTYNSYGPVYFKFKQIKMAASLDQFKINIKFNRLVAIVNSSDFE